MKTQTHGLKCKKISAVRPSQLTLRQSLSHYCSLKRGPRNLTKRTFLSKAPDLWFESTGPCTRTRTGSLEAGYDVERKKEWTMLANEEISDRIRVRSFLNCVSCLSGFGFTFF
ncbi:hypothetical protein CEXT_754621 [Caerostris extrusa]|uniref:Uncharacterized protein n=1 Tax=Caerostris extrusa TaxID=172846 RepID=A0AAV4MY62_CAEEX|nr:hypothetical protein CEXT_754621 [Caerostris extrusa]